MTGMVGMGLNVAGALGTAYGYQEQGAAAATAANTNAALADQNAEIAVEQAQHDETVQERQAYIALGQQKSLYGASGVTGDSGSALDVLAASAANAELDRQTIAYKGRMKALGYAEQAVIDRRGGQTAMSEADKKASAVMFQALGSTATQASGYINFNGGGGGSDAPMTDSTMGDALP